MDSFDDPPAKIFQFATQKFAKEIPEFKEKMMQLEMKHKGAFEKIMSDPSVTDDFIDQSIKVPIMRSVSDSASIDFVGDLKKLESDPLITDNEDTNANRVQTDGIENLMEPINEMTEPEVQITEETPGENKEEQVFENKEEPIIENKEEGNPEVTEEISNKEEEELN